MILNNFVTMRRISALKDKSLSAELVLEIHRIITEKTLEDDTAAGRLRSPNEQIVVGDMYGEVFHEPPPAEQLRQRMDLMCDFANGKIPETFVHPVLRSIILHFWLASTIPSSTAMAGWRGPCSTGQCFTTDTGSSSLCRSLRSS